MNERILDLSSLPFEVEHLERIDTHPDYMLTIVKAPVILEGELEIRNRSIFNELDKEGVTIKTKTVLDKDTQLIKPSINHTTSVDLPEGLNSYLAVVDIYTKVSRISNRKPETNFSNVTSERLFIVDDSKPRSVERRVLPNDKGFDMTGVVESEL